jgi:hypothetical protein
MLVPIPPKPAFAEQKQFPPNDLPLLLLSIGLQLILGLLFGHIYDTRIFMATGYLVGTGQNPYIPQDLSSVFHNMHFQGITTVGYPPPWPLALGFIYRIVYSIVPNFLVYNLAIKIPIIAANIGLAYLVAALIRRLGAVTATVRKAWIFMLLNPFLLYASTAWGQIDSIVALISLSALVLLASGKVKSSAILLALAISFKPTALPLLPIAFFYLKRKSVRQTLSYYVVLFIGAFLFCIVPFFIFGWDLSPILQHWNVHFVVGGGLSFMTFLELTHNTVLIPGAWWFVGLLWVPALGIAVYALRPGIVDLTDLIKKCTALIMVFYLIRAWVSEPNILLVLPLVLILISIGVLERPMLAAIWILPLIFSFFNTSTAQLFFSSMPAIMEKLLGLMDGYRTARLVAKLIIVVPWQFVGWWVVIRCFKRVPARSENITPQNHCLEG